MSKQGKWISFALVVVVLGGLLAATAAKKGSKPVDVRIETVQARDLVSAVTASGQVSAHTKVDLAADISGRIVRLAVKEGDMVTKGQFLLQIDPAVYEAAVQRSEAAMASARAQAAQAKASYEQAKRNYDRSAAIRRENAQLISDEQLEQLRTAVEVNQALADAATHSVDQAMAALRDARSQLEKTTILAPMSGRVTRLNVEQGETAVPGTFNKDAATLLTISDMTVLETKVKVDETDVARISVGDSAQVQIDAFPDTTFTGRVVEISNSSVKGATAVGGGEAAIDYEVTVRLENPPRDTRPDFSSTAKIITDSRRNALSVPIIALTVRENEKIDSTDVSARVASSTKQVGKKDVEGVFVVAKDNRVSFRPVKVGISGERYFEVLSGLRPGERIVAGTYQAIRELRDSAMVREAKTDDTKPKDAKS